MTIKCAVKLNNQNGNGIFFAGQNVSGAIEITLTEIHTVKGISITIKGEAFCKWSEHKQNMAMGRSTSHISHRVYTGHETYLNSKTYVVQKSANGVDINLPPGVHVFHFACQLPRQIPPSIEDCLGYIRYQVIVTIERPWKTDLKYPVIFNVLIPLDLNFFDSVARQPKLVEKSFKFFNWMESTNPLVLRLSIPRTGYAIGEVLSINIDANNLSSVDIKCLRFSLLQNIMYHSNGPMRHSRLVTNRKIKQTSGMLQKLKHVNFDQHITIPYLPVTDDSCSVLSVSYDLEVVVVAKGWHNDKRVLVPIIIGNVPLNNNGYIPICGLSNIPTCSNNGDVPLINKFLF